MNEETQSCRLGRPKDSAKREEIVTATLLFLEKGYELTSMEAVAKQAGVSKLTIYSHFADKSELFRAIIQYRCDKLGMPKSFMDEAHLPPEQVLLKIAGHAVSLIFRADSIRLMRVIQGEALRHPEVVKIYYEVGPRRIKNAFADLLREFDRQKQLSISDPERATEQFFSLLKGERLSRVLMGLNPEPNIEELAAHVKAAVEMFLAAYRNPLSRTAGEGAAVLTAVGEGVTGIPTAVSSPTTPSPVSRKKEREPPSPAVRERESMRQPAGKTRS